MTYPPRRAWYGRWWYLWVAAAMGIALWWVFIFGGILFVAEEMTDTAVGRDGIIVENGTGSGNRTLLLNETV